MRPQTVQRVVKRARQRFALPQVLGPACRTRRTSRGRHHSPVAPTLVQGPGRGGARKQLLMDSAPRPVQPPALEAAELGDYLP